MWGFMNFINKDNLFLLEEIVKNNFSSIYKDSILGMLWTILNPLLMMALFTIIFSTLFKRNIDNFPVYFLCGWCIVTFFNRVIGVAMYSLKGNKNILQRTPAPKHIFVMGSIISEGLTFIIMLILLVIIMIITHAPFYWFTIPFSIIPVASLLFMITGLGLMVSIICVYYSDLQHLWSVISMAIFYSSSVFYPMEIFPEPFHQYLVLNPVYWVVDQFRSFIYYGVFPSLIQILNLVLLSLIILVFGLIVFKKYEDKVTMNF